MDNIDEINKLRKTTFTVSGISIFDLKLFKNFCKDECGDVYHVGITQLMKYKERYENLSILLSSLQKQIDELKTQLNKQVKRPKTFGDDE